MRTWRRLDNASRDWLIVDYLPLGRVIHRPNLSFQENAVRNPITSKLPQVSDRSLEFHRCAPRLRRSSSPSGERRLQGRCNLRVMWYAKP